MVDDGSGRKLSLEAQRVSSLGQSRCPSCGAETEPGSRFCASCGRVLVEACPSCGAETSVGTRFCAACGHRLDRPSAKEEERKLVTVLFSDLTGSTALGEQLDPERLRTLLSEYFTAMASVIESQGGVVEKFIGDAVMAVFGIPTAHEDDAERALRAALGMQTRLEELNAEIAGAARRRASDPHWRQLGRGHRGVRGRPVYGHRRRRQQAVTLTPHDTLIHRP
jgi:uncharacterized OB-fold protein